MVEEVQLYLPASSDDGLSRRLPSTMFIFFACSAACSLAGSLGSSHMCRSGDVANCNAVYRALCEGALSVQYSAYRGPSPRGPPHWGRSRHRDLVGAGPSTLSIFTAWIVDH